MNFFILGPSGSGKSTLVKQMLKGTDDVCGFLTVAHRQDDICSISIEDIFTGQRLLVARFEICSRKMLELCPEAFDVLAQKCFRTDAQIAVLDELGTFESLSFGFQKKVHLILDSAMPVIAVVQRPITPFLRQALRHEGIRINLQKK